MRRTTAITPTAPAGHPFPDATNTGYTPTGVTLVAVPGTTTTAAGAGGANTGWAWGVDPATGLSSLVVSGTNAVVDSVDVAGRIVVQVAGATIKRSRARSAHLQTSAATFGVVGSQSVGYTIQDCVVDGLGGNGSQAHPPDTFGLFTNNIVVQRCEIVGVANGYQGNNSTFTDTWIHNLAQISGTGHLDCVQLDGCSGNTFTHCTLSNPNTQAGVTSCVMMDNFGGAATNNTVQTSLLIGGQYTVYQDSSQSTGTSCTGNVVINNRFQQGVFGYAQWSDGAHGTTANYPLFHGNVDDVTGSEAAVVAVHTVNADQAPFTTVTQATVPTGVPSAAVATAGTGSASIAFTGVTAPNNGGAAIDLYRATSTPGGFTATGTSPIVVSGLANGTPYTFTVAAHNRVGYGAESPASNSATPTGATVPGAPTSVTAVGGDTQVIVTWVDPASNGGSAIIDYTATSSPGGLTGTATGATATTATVGGLTNGVAYTFTVKARNTVGSSIASGASASVTPNTGGAGTFPNATTSPHVVGSNLVLTDSGGTLRTVPLSASGAITTTGVGQTIGSLAGGFTAPSVYVAHNNCTIQYCLIQSSQPTGFLVQIKSGVTGTIIQYCEIDGLNTSFDGIAGEGFNGAVPGGYDCFLNTVFHCNIHGMENGIDPYNGTIQGCYIHDLVNNAPGAAPHYDGIEIGQANGLTITGNTILAPSETSAINLTSWQGNISNVTISNNLLGGGTYTLNDDTSQGGTITGVAINNNRWKSDAQFGLRHGSAMSFTQTGNVDDATGNPVTL